MAEIPKWSIQGDWFDTCKCTIPCPCYFAQPPTSGDCDGILAWHIREGTYGQIPLSGLNVLAIGAFEGNIWAGETKVAMGIFIDERADERQREALQTIFGGHAGGWPGVFANFIGEVRGIEFARIEFKVDDDLGWWRAKIPGRVLASGEALSGPTTLPGQRVQVHNPPGAEVGPGAIATQGKATSDRAEAFGFKWDRTGRSSKHMGFNWSGPDAA
ncbi:MAG TPA: DUF1326 domain-containing protein [Bryobacteraceae bacterium]|jgi:hypothetical protein